MYTSTVAKLEAVVMSNNPYETILNNLTDEQREILLLRKAGFSYLEIIDIVEKRAIPLTINEVKILIKKAANRIHEQEPSLTPLSANKIGFVLSGTEQYDFNIVESFLKLLPVINAPDGLRDRINKIFKSR